MRAVLLLLLTGLAAGGQEIVDLGLADEKWLIRVEGMMIAVPVESAFSHLPGLRDSSHFDETWAKLQALLGKRDAKLLGWPIALCGNRKRGTSSTVEEARYPDSENPFRSSRPFRTVAGRKPPDPMRAFYKIMAHLSFYHYPDGSPAPLASGVKVPQSFETQNVGAWLDAQAFTEDGSLIELDVGLNYGTNLGFRQIPGEQSQIGTRATMSIADIHTHTSTAKVLVQSGKPVLLSSSFVTEPEPRVIISIIKASRPRPPYR